MKIFTQTLSFKSDLLVTALNGLVVIGGVFILNGIIARMHGLEVLGEFLLVKRTLSAFVGILLIGMNVGLPNYLSRNFEKAYGDNSFILYIIFTIPLTILFVFLILWYNVSGFYTNYFWVYIIFSLGVSSQFITYALYRGYMNMIGANIFQLLGTALIPIIFFTNINNLYDSLFWIGSSVLILMVFGFLMRNKGISLKAINYNILQKILKYGIKRVPSFLSQFILLAGIPIYIASSQNFESIAYFNSSLSLVRLTLIFINPIGMVLLPRIANKIAKGEKKNISKVLDLFFKGGIILSVIATTYCYIYAPLILKLWLGDVSNSGLSILRFAILALPFYAFSGLSRSPIDAISEKGYNSVIYGVAAISMIVLIIIGKIFEFELLTTALFSFLISHIIAGGVSAYYIQKLYNHWFLKPKLFRDIIISILGLVAINNIVSILEISLVSQFIVFNLIIILVMTTIFKKVNTGWIAEIKSELYGR